MAAFLLCSLLLPGIVTDIAPRRHFLWGAVPLGLMFAWSLANRIVVFNGPGLASDFRENGIAALILLLVVCGPVSFIRLQMRRGRAAPARRLADYQAWAQGAAEAQAGVCPPPFAKTDTMREKSDLILLVRPALLPLRFGSPPPVLLGYTNMCARSS